MTDFLGALEIPIPVPGPRDTVADPFLDLLADFLRTAINADSKAAWATIHPAKVGIEIGEPAPITVARSRNPVAGDFQSKILPALFVFRKSSGKRMKVAQDTWVTPTLIHVLWVPPRATLTFAAKRSPFDHAIEACLDRCIDGGRHPAWVKQGDTDPTASDQGSYFYKYARLYDEPDILKTEDFQLRLPNVDDSKQSDDYDCFLASMEIREARQKTAAGYAVFDHVESTVSIGTPGLSVLGFSFYPTLTSLAPASGPAAGATALTIVGQQLPDGTLFTIDGVPLTGVTRVDDDTFTATSPAHAAGGPYALTATTPAGQSAALSNAFTYV